MMGKDAAFLAGFTSVWDLSNEGMDSGGDEVQLGSSDQRPKTKVH